ncbi:hypothetical protein DPMN_166559 [Dreissena polymorpha]|uniref:Uncharacterized protein n=1 Tax=Dreissena polymorpha TaxID=45954 RepID=A0A9D4DSX7_DREPO|nr:hypothetical protein DPMN_188172 [Dreissena polymorpha]KAH3788371.1 hypothetical protein DPMN_166508 [Dreissena polymorpha]KAH3788415.1 hypothetical protein DPMN_166559 [Dreissena polymorpha]
MSCCVDGFLQNWAVCAVVMGCGEAGKRKDFQMCAGSLSLAAEVNSRVFWSSNNMLEGVLIHYSTSLEDADGSDGFSS